MDLLKRLEEIVARRQEVEKELSDPDVVNDIQRFTKLNKEYSELEPLQEMYYEYKDLLSNIENNKAILSENGQENELKEMAKQELEDLEAKRGPMEEKIKQMLVPPDPADDKNAIVEIRAGAGGDEASLFAGDLYKMYQKFCEEMGWKTELINATEGSTGGFKEIIFNVKGKNVYGTLKYESGVHRVQRVPETESQGRVHTSAASIVVLPEAEAIDVDIKDADIRRDTFCASGPGGQSVNTTYSAVRLTHIPTGIVATCQDQKSQLKNHDKAMQVLRSRIYEQELQKQMAEISSQRKTMVSTGDRSAKIRTYNFPQSRVTDHRVNHTSYNLDSIMDGAIYEFIDALKVAENAEKLKEGKLEEEEAS